MPKLVLRKPLGSPRPADEQSEDWLRKIANGECIMVEARKPRNIQHHRKLFALLKLVCDNVDEKITPELLLGLIKLRTGYSELIRTRKGEVLIPKSIAFESLDQHGFDEFYNAAVHFIIQDILPVSRDELEKELLEMVA